MLLVPIVASKRHTQVLLRRRITKNECNAARTLGDHNPDAGRQQTYFVAAIPSAVALHTSSGAYETSSSLILTSLQHLTRWPFKLHVGSEARHSQRPDPQIPANMFILSIYHTLVVGA